MLLIRLSFSYSQDINSPGHDMPPDLLIRLVNIPNSGDFTFCVKKVGIIFSGDNYNPAYCPPEKKVYGEKYFRRYSSDCSFDLEREIIGKCETITWTSQPSDGVSVKYDYIAHGAPRALYSWLGFGLYHFIIKDNIEHSIYSFYIDFGESTFREPPGLMGSDIKIEYDTSMPLNTRVKIIAYSGVGSIYVENGKVYRIWNELKLEPNLVRNGIFFMNNIIPLNSLSCDTLLSPAIVDVNTAISSGKIIIIDPYLYPEPSKLNDLKLTIADNTTLTSQNNSTLFVGDDAQISLGSNSTVNIATGGNFFIGSNSKWSFGANSQLIVNGNFKVTSKIQSGWQMLSVPNLISDFTKTVVWPNAISNAFTLEGGAYVIKNTLENGKG